MTGRIGAIVMAVLLVVYVALVGQRTYLLLVSGEPIGIAMGIALIVIPVIALWAVGRELWFGVRAEQLGRRMEREGGLPEDLVALRPSGGVVRADGDAAFPRYREDAEATPDDWRVWFRLGLVYDAAGDRRRAREAVRRAIRLERTDRTG